MAVNDILVLQLRTIGASDTAKDGWSVLPPIFNAGSSNAKWLLVGADIIPQITQAASDTNYRTYKVYGKDLTTAQSTRATNVAGGALTAGTNYPQTLTGGSNAVFLPGDEVRVESGTGGGTEPADETQWVLTFELQR